MKPRRTLTILDAIADEKLFARWFRDKSTWQAWRAFLAALFALPMAPEQLDRIPAMHRPHRAADDTGKRGLADLWTPRR